MVKVFLVPFLYSLTFGSIRGLVASVYPAHAVIVNVYLRQGELFFVSMLLSLPDLCLPHS